MKKLADEFIKAKKAKDLAKIKYDLAKKAFLTYCNTKNIGEITSTKGKKVKVLNNSRNTVNAQTLIALAKPHAKFIKKATKHSAWQELKID